MAYTDYRLSVTGSTSKIYLKVSELRVILGLPTDDVKVATQADLDTLLEFIQTLQSEVDNIENNDPIDLTLYVTKEQLLGFESSLVELQTSVVGLESLIDIQVERIQTLEDEVDDLKTLSQTNTSELVTVKQNINILNDRTQELISDLEEVATSIPSLSDVLGNVAEVSQTGLIKIGTLKVFVSEVTTDSNGVFNADYADANFNQVLFQIPVAYADANYTTTGASNFACLYKETETLTSVQGVVKSAEGVGLLVGTVLVSKKNARVKVITVGV